MDSKAYETRVSNLRRLMKADGVGGYITTASRNLYYFAGFFEEPDPRYLGLFIPVTGEPILVVNDLYATQIREESWIPTVITWSDGEEPLDKLAKAIEDAGLGGAKFAVDDSMWSTFLLKLQDRLPQARFIPGGQYMSTLRRLKSAQEKEYMMYIGAATDKVMDMAIAAVRPGVTEASVSDVIDQGFKKLGVGSSGRNAVVGSGVYSAQPHYRATEKVIQRGDSVVIDFGGFWKLYKSDMTRTVFVGKPDPEYLKIYDAVRKAQETAVDSIKPGMTCQDVDRIARKVINDAGYGQYFIHRTGHGIGLEGHEEPSMVEGNTLVVEPGLTFSVEPGIYIPGRYGVRIEDCVIVTDTGCERFTDYSRNLVIID